jgi:hypothetical protein
MTRVSGGRSRKVGLLNGGEWAVVDMVSGRRASGQNVESLVEGLSIAGHMSSKDVVVPFASQEPLGFEF